jgi:peroxiredoxin
MMVTSRDIRAMNLRNLTRAVCQAVLMAVGSAALSTVAQAPNQPLPVDPDKAWEQVREMHDAVASRCRLSKSEPSEQELNEHCARVKTDSLAWVAQLHEFIERFPTHPNAATVRLHVVAGLSWAMAAGHPSAEQDLDRYTLATAADQTISDFLKINIFVESTASKVIVKKSGTRFFIKGVNGMTYELRAAFDDALREAAKRFPASPSVYFLMMRRVEEYPSGEAQQWAREVSAATNAPPNMRTAAQFYLQKEKPHEVGQPIEFRFSASDGREIDSAKLKGRVVLLYFWSAGSAPAKFLAFEVNEIKKLYAAFGSKGLEVVGINMDESEELFRQSMRDHEIPWPQYRDPKGPANEVAVRYGVWKIPTYWVIGRTGKLEAKSWEVGSQNFEGKVREAVSPPAQSRRPGP